MQQFFVPFFHVSPPGSGKMIFKAVQVGRRYITVVGRPITHSKIPPKMLIYVFTIDYHSLTGKAVEKPRFPK